MKKILGILIILLFASVVVGCNASEPMKESGSIENQEKDEMKDMSESENEVVSELLEFSLEELSVYNGKDGNLAYIAVDGVVYDVTNSSQWNNGGHNGAVAGEDVSDLMKNAPHGLSKLNSVEVVGVLVE